MKKIDIYALIWGSCVALSSAFVVLLYVTLSNSPTTIITPTHIFTQDLFILGLFLLSVCFYYFVCLVGGVLFIIAYFHLTKKLKKGV